MSRKAVILFNLGGPDKKESIRPFLFNFFMDKNIIRAPLPVRYTLANLIANKRSRKEAGESYHELGDKSPLLENSQLQVKALEKKLNEKSDRDEYKCFICMRYWHPMAQQVAKDVQEWGPDHIVLLPLYPQYSTTTTRSSFQQWEKACDEIDLLVPTSSVCCYPWEDGFVKASAENIKNIYQEAEKQSGKKPRVLFSAHGLPESVIDDGDPYQWQCEKTAQAIADTTGIENLDWQICYQSRVGPMKWIGPSTEEALQQAAKDNVPVVILPHAFTQEHVETLVEIEIEYREIAEQLGLKDFYRVPTVGVSEYFIDGLADTVLKLDYQTWTSSDTGKRLCPQNYKRCCMA